MTERTRKLTSPWPFQWSVVPRRGLVRNVAPPAKKPARLAKVRPPNKWTQETLL